MPLVNARERSNASAEIRGIEKQPDTPAETLLSLYCTVEATCC